MGAAARNLVDSRPLDAMPPASVPSRSWDRRDVLLVGGSALAAAGWFAWSLGWTAGQSKLGPWLAMLAILAAFTLGVGHALTGSWKAVLIDDRNKTSLSRLQLVLWSGLILSAYATAAAWNRTAGSGAPLAVEMPRELWLLMGLSSATLAGSTLIKGGQERQPSALLNTPTADLPPTAALRKEAVVEALDASHQTPMGLLAQNRDPAMARWTDMFKGEGIDTFEDLDLGKIQLFYFTVFLVALYALALGDLFAYHATGPDQFRFPVFDEAMLGLLGISHAGYLTTKATKHAGSP